MVNTQQKQDYGIIHQGFIWIAELFKSLYNNFQKRRLEKLIKQAEEKRATTSYRYYVIKFKGRLRIIPKKTFKGWLQAGKLKKGTTIRDIEKMAIYITKG